MEENTCDRIGGEERKKEDTEGRNRGRVHAEEYIGNRSNIDKLEEIEKGNVLI